jgi:transcriptional regulator with XRE-family HTH domain
MNRFEQLRYERGLTQQQVADGAGVSRKTIARLERAPHMRPNAAVAHALARFYGLTVSQMLDPDASPFPPNTTERAA